jgi:hypothetical protein
MATLAGAGDDGFAGLPIRVCDDWPNQLANISSKFRSSSA